MASTSGSTKAPTAVAFDSFFNIIGGERESGSSTFQAANPSTLAANPPAPLSSKDDVDRAIAAAKAALPVWAATPVAERQQAVIRLADALAAQTNDFATMLVKEQGKPLPIAKAEVANAVAVLKGVANLPFPAEQVIEDTPKRRISSRYVPIGVSVGIIPWNFPVILAATKIGPALVAGSPLILKPSPFTPYCNLKIAELAMQFLPPGVLQALSGDDNLGAWFTEHPGVAKVAFTGSTSTGKKVMQSCSKNLTRVTLELGGNDAAIIRPDVDIQTVALHIAIKALLNSGQICIAVKRVYVHASIYDAFLATLTAIAKSFPVADGFTEGAFIGPVQNAAQYKIVQDLMDDVAKNQFRVTTDGERPPLPEKGFFFNPMIVDNPPDDARIVQEEPFGPVFPVMKWTDEADVVRRANDSDVGLGASVWSNDIAAAERIGRQLEAGTVWINGHSELYPNAPFAGHKHSGIGAELGVQGIQSYCNVQTIAAYKQITPPEMQ